MLRGKYPRKPIIERFWIKINKGKSCWNWNGAATGFGYGRFWGGNTYELSHRWSYMHFVGPIPEGLTIDHLCRNTRCVNPSHLEPVTMRENIMRGNSLSALNAKKTHCKRRHKFDEKNTYRYIAKYGPGRGCRLCNRERSRQLRLKLKKIKNITDISKG